MQTEIFGVSKFKKTFDTGSRLRKTYAAGVHWTKHNSFILTIDGVKVAEQPKNTSYHRYH